MKKFSSVLFLCLGIAYLLSVCAGDIESYGSYGQRNQPLLRSFNGFKYDVTRDSDGVYKFSYHAGDSSRKEQRTVDGLVTGEYAFVVPEGHEIDVKYEADGDGFRVESDALPLSPDDTDEVKKAREYFFQEYQKALERAGDEEDEEDSGKDHGGDSTSEESSEENEEGDGEELALFTYYGFLPSNAVENPDDDDEDSESSEEEEEEEEEEEGKEEKEGREKQNERRGRGQSRFVNSAAYAHFGRRIPLPLSRN